MNPIFKVFIFDQNNICHVYLSSDIDQKDISANELEKKEDGWLLRGFYYGSSTCIRSDGLGWIGAIQYPTSFEQLREMKNFPMVTNKKKLRIIIQVGNENEEIKFEYPNNFYKPYIQLDGYRLLKGIYFRELSRFSFISDENKYVGVPIEISGVKFN